MISGRIALQFPKGENFCVFRTLAHGDKKAGFSVFWADDGLDTGPILLQKTTYVDRNDTVDSIYNRFMYPEGIKAMVRKFAGKRVQNWVRKGECAVCFRKILRVRRFGAVAKVVALFLLSCGGEAKTGCFNVQGRQRRKCQAKMLFLHKQK